MDDDEGAAIRTVIARCFAAQAACVHCEDLDDHLETAEKIATWILDGKYVPNGFAAACDTADKLLAQARTNLKAKKKGGK